MPEVASYKIGLNKGKRRIWLDGRRLTVAGFIGGTHYLCTVQPGRITCRIPTPEELADPAPFPTPKDGYAKARKVTGRPDGKPIIDMLGKDVEAAFPTGDAVKATFSPGLIILEK